MSDLIERQAAIDALSDGALVNYQAAGHNNGLVKAIDVIKGLPSAQPEIVRCRECKHWEYDVIFADGWCREKHQGDPNWFCADGERKESNG